MLVASCPSDRVYRGYYFFLLYWMLRKLHLQDKGLSHVKVAMALYSGRDLPSLQPAALADGSSTGRGEKQILVFPGHRQLQTSRAFENLLAI
jgi:hypothetical protein